MDALEKEVFDCVVYGTGLANSIVAAALSSSGNKVLHIDQNSFYGENEATFQLDHLLDQGPFEQYKILSNDLPEELETHKAKFRVDLSPRLVLSRGKSIDSIVKAKLFETTDFHFVDDLFTLIKSDNGVSNLFEVPCSKSEVFNNKQLRLLEKRQLMKFLQFVLDVAKTSNFGASDENTEGNVMSTLEWVNEAGLNIGRSLQRPQNLAPNVWENILSNVDDSNEGVHEFVKKNFKLSDRLSKLICFSIALYESDDEIKKSSAKEFLKKVVSYVSSIGRYSLKNIFIFPAYGLSELCEGFCRIAAVNGATYILRQELESVSEKTSDSKLLNVRFRSGENITTKNFIHSDRSVCEESSNLEALHFIFICKTSLFKRNSCSEDATKRSFLVVPPNSFSMGSQGTNQFAVHVVELGSGVNMAPEGYFVVHCSSLISKIDIEKETMTFKTNLVEFLTSLSEEGSWSSVWDCSLMKKNISSKLNIETSENSDNVFTTTQSSKLVSSTECYFEEAIRILKQVDPGNDFCT